MKFCILWLVPVKLKNSIFPRHFFFQCKTLLFHISTWESYTEGLNPVCNVSIIIITSFFSVFTIFFCNSILGRSGDERCDIGNKSRWSTSQSCQSHAKLNASKWKESILTWTEEVMSTTETLETSCKWVQVPTTLSICVLHH